MEEHRMKNSENHFKDSKPATVLTYIQLVRINWMKILIISSVFFAGTLIYSFTLDDIFESKTTLRISDPTGSILKSPFTEIGDFAYSAKDRFIANEIVTLQNVTLRKMVAQTILDSLDTMKEKNELYLVLDKELSTPHKPSIRSFDAIVNALGSAVKITQPMGLDFIEIAAESPSPREASLFANAYADAYRRFNLMDSRRQFANIKDFLKNQAEEKRRELIVAENNVKMYQLKGGVIELDKQASALLDNLTGFEAKRNAADIELSMIEKRLTSLKNEVNKKDPSLTSFLETRATEPYLQLLQKKIAETEAQRDFALANKSIGKNPAAVKEYDATLKELKDKLKTSISEYQKSILSSSPEEVKKLMQDVFEEEINYQSLKASHDQINHVIRGYESKFNRLPDKALDLARLERERMSLEKLYSILEEKYQEAIVNEQSTPGNVLLLSSATPAYSPSGPDRFKISIIGLLLGLATSLVFVYLKTYFDNTVKSPEDITDRGYNLLGWLPGMKINKATPDLGLVALRSPNSVLGEAFRTLRTRIQFSKVLKNGKVLLVTSSAPNEGKTFSSCNLAASFSSINTKTVILDCDLRIPKVHTYFDAKKLPGFVDFFIGEAYYDDIIRSTENPNLYFIPAGKTPPNPSEILSSSRMKAFIQKLRNEFDLVILDTPPIMSVADSEILLEFIDMSILVVSANTTKTEWMLDSIGLLSGGLRNSFIGVLLNKFNYKSSGYKSKYNYFNYYSTKGGTNKAKQVA